MRWLFLVHQIRPQPSRARVKIWRALKRIGAVLHRNSVYVLPYSKDQQEDFEWLCQQIRDQGGEASVFVSEAPTDQENRELVAQFQAARTIDYQELLKQCQALERRVEAARDEKHFSSAHIQKLFSGGENLKSLLEQIRKVDFFEAPLSRTTGERIRRLERGLQRLHASNPGVSLAQPAPRFSLKDFAGKTWVTRRDLHMDRLASAWLIRRFIDSKARFVFAEENRIPRGPIPFDTFGAELSHHGEDCTFETFIKRFQMQSDSALVNIAEMVHDMDLKDEKFGRPEAAGVDLVIQALCTTIPEDARRLNEGMKLFDRLYAHLRARRKSKKYARTPRRVHR